MIKIKDLNPNTRVYWNNVYKGDENREHYVEVTKGVNGASQRFETVLQSINNGDKFLDIGCGIGILTKMVKERYPDCEVWGSDISDEAIKKNSTENQEVHYVQHYIGSPSMIKDNYFDRVFSGEVLEHIDDPNDLFIEANKALKPGGVFILTTPKENRINSEEHVWSFTQKDINKLYEDNGFATPLFTELPDLEHIYVIFAVGIKK